MIKLRKIEIHGVHGMDAVYELNDKTGFLGRNGAGKSTVLKSIQWALLGYIPGTNKTNTAIFQHAVGRGMSVNLTLDVDGAPVTIFRQLTKSGSSIASTFEVDPASYTGKIDDIIKRIELPSFNFVEFAGMTANKLKDWFIDYLPKSEVAINWNEFIKNTLDENNVNLFQPEEEEFRTSLLDKIHELGRSFTGIELIRKVNEYLKTRVSEVNADSKRIASTLQSLVRYDGDDEMTLVGAKLALARAQMSRNRVIEYLQIEQHNSEIFTKLADYLLPGTSADTDMEILGLRDAIANLKARKADVDDVVSRLRGLLLSIEGQRSAYSKMLSGSCPMFPDVSCPHIKEAHDKAVDELAGLDNEQQATQADLERSLQQLNDIKLGLNDLLKKHDDLCAKYAERERLQSMYKVLPNVSDMTTCSLDYWNEEIARLNRVIGQMENNELFEKLQRDKFGADIQLDAYKVLEKATGVNGLQTKLDSPFAKLISMMNDDLAQLLDANYSGCVAEFVLAEKANSFSFGIRKDDMYIPYELLSSGEKTLYCLALLAALCRLNPDIRLMVIDDLFDYLDKENYERAMNWVATVPDIQIVFASVNISVRNEIHYNSVYNFSRR